MIKRLSELAKIYTGQSIRKTITNHPDGAFFIVQMKDVDKNSGINLATLYRTNIKTNIGPKLIKKGDILFAPRACRGSSPYSVIVNIDLPNLIAAPTFYVILVDDKIVRSEYVHWFINSIAHGGKFIKKNAIGGSVINLPKNILSEMELIVPPLKVQDSFIKCLNAAKKEKQISDNIYKMKQDLMHEFIKDYT